MQTLSLDEPPPGLTSEGAHLWLRGDGQDPLVGDLWLLSWDGIAAGLIVVARVLDGFVLAWPATLPGDPSFRPAIHVDNEALGLRLTVWPSFETGVGTHLLHRCLGSAMSLSAVDNVRHATMAGHDGPLPYAPTEYDEAAHAAFLSELLSTYQRLCFNQWPTAPDESQIQRLARTWAVDEQELLAPASGEWISELRKPRYKTALRQIAERGRINERMAREAVYSEYAIAGPGRTEDKVRNAIHRVLETLTAGVPTASGELPNRGVVSGSPHRWLLAAAAAAVILLAGVIPLSWRPWESGKSTLATSASAPPFAPSTITFTASAPPSITITSTIAVPPPSQLPTDPTARLEAVVPSDYKDRCGLSSDTVSGAVATLRCSTGGQFDTLAYSLFPDQATLDRNFTDFTGAPVPCPGWGQPPQHWYDPAHPEQTKGKLLCAINTSPVNGAESSILKWSIDSDLVIGSVAGHEGQSFAQLYQWWAAHYQ
jgi:hypothetical protein